MGWKKGAFGGIASSTVRLTPTQLLNLHGTPVDIVPAQSGTIILPLMFAAIYIPNTTPYTSTSSSIFAIWSGDSGGNYALTGFVANWATFTGGNNFGISNITGFAPLMSSSIPESQALGSSIQIKNFGTNLSAGDGSLEITTLYGRYTP